MKGCSPSRSRYCLDTCSKNKATSIYFSVYTNIKKLCPDKIRLKWKGMGEGGGINLSKASPVTMGRGEGAKALLIPSLIVWPVRPFLTFIFVVVYNFILYYILLPNITNLSIHCENIVFSINSCPDIPMFRFCLCGGFFCVCVHIFFSLSHALT